MKLRCQGFREKYGCDECGHRDWQWPVRIIRPYVPTTATIAAGFIPEMWMHEARLAAEHGAVLASAIEKKADAPYGSTIHIPRVTR